MPGRGRSPAPLGTRSTTTFDRSEPGPSTERLSWLCTFVEGTGLRAAELLCARRKDLQQLPSGWVLQVHGKGRRNRLVPVPARALQATRRYFEGQGLDFDNVPADTPLLAAVDGLQTASYRALADQVTAHPRERGLWGGRCRAGHPAGKLRPSRSAHDCALCAVAAGAPAAGHGKAFGTT